MARVHWIALLFFLFAYPNSADAQRSADTEKLDSYFKELQSNDRFSGSVILMKGDDILFQNAYGSIDKDGTPATPQSLYRVASITKSYTSALILRFVEQGDLSLKTTLNSYFPGIPNAEQITIEQLLRHQSGLANFTGLQSYTDYFTAERSREEMIEHFESIETVFEPGKRSAYSNTGYVLLGYIIEEISGLSYSEALREMITGPLGLNSTYFSRSTGLGQYEADSFIYEKGGWVPAPQTNLEILHGAAAIVSTAEEVAKFYRALFSGDILSEGSLENMTRFEGQFGLGTIRFSFYDKAMIGHHGRIDGFQSHSAHIVEDDVTFAILANSLNHQFNDILNGFLSITFGKEFEMPDLEQRIPVSLAEEKLDRYTGIYSSEDFPRHIIVSVVEGSLMAYPIGQDAFLLTIYNDREMGSEQAGIEILFDEIEAGRYRGFQFSRSGKHFNFSLIDESD